MNNFKPIPGYEKLYAVDTCGNVMRIKKETNTKHGKLLTPYKNNAGYLYVSLKSKNKFYVHRLVLMTHVGPISPGLQVNHINGIKTDNRIENLELVTATQNIRHSIDVLGRKMSSGKNHYKSYLILDTATGIFYDTMKEAARCIDVNYNTLKHYIAGRHTNKTNLKLV
jgi:hypothetical protein